MNLDFVRAEIRNQLGKESRFIYKGCRNQIEEFIGVITKCFPSIFIVKTKDNEIKSFTYSDYIIGNLKIY